MIAHVNGSEPTETVLLGFTLMLPSVSLLLRILDFVLCISKQVSATSDVRRVALACLEIDSDISLPVLAKHLLPTSSDGFTSA